jgi:predicted ArsR family transcriptional regulator
VEENILFSEGEIIKILKKEGPLSMAELGTRLEVSKVSVLKKLRKLEEKGYINRRIKKTEMGRPVYVFYLSTNANIPLNGNSALKLLNEFVSFLYDNGKQEIAENFLKERYRLTLQIYRKQMGSNADGDILNKLVKIRQNDQYDAELQGSNSNTKIMIEYNCPIFELASKFPIACQLENSMFSSLTEMKVSNEHRQTNGSSTCRFIFRSGKEPE